MGKDDPNTDIRPQTVFLSCDACGFDRTPLDDYGSTFRLMDVWRSRPKTWPDILRSFSSDVWAVDEKVASDMEAARLTGYRLQELVVEDSIPKRKRPPKPYWVVVPTGCASFINSAHPERPYRSCPDCGRILVRPDDDAKLSLRLLEGSWDGADWVLAKQNNIWKFVCCSPRVVECARTFGWQNAHFGLPCAGGAFNLFEIAVDYHAENWKELLEFDLERGTRNLLRNYKRPVEKEPSGLRRPIPIYPPGFVPPSPKHPFDDLGDFDGSCGWHGTVECACLFGWGELFVELDTPHPERVPDGKRPPKRIKEVFDIFRESEKSLFPELDAILRKALAENGLPAPPVATPGDLGDFSAVLPRGGASLAVEDPGKAAVGFVELDYTLADSSPRKSLGVRIAVDRKAKTVAVVSSETG